MTKEGFTKAGKSLKAVRRYYAQKNASKPRAPDDDKLSKRIAQELKTQQDANQRRLATTSATTNTIATKNVLSEAVSEIPPLTEPSALPTETPNEVPTKPSVSFGKPPQSTSVKTTRSVQNLDSDSSYNIESLILGGLITLAVLFQAAAAYLLVTQSDEKSPLAYKKEVGFFTRWLGLISVFIVSVAVYWICKRQQMVHAVVCFIFMILSCISTAYAISTSRHYIVGYQRSEKINIFSLDLPLLSALVIGYLVLQLLVLTLMIMQIINIMSQTGEKSVTKVEFQDTAGLSNILSPMDQS